MARTRQIKNPPSRLSQQLVKNLRESALWVFIAFAFLLLVALISYDPTDPGFMQASGNGEVQNAVGRFGALTADLLFNLFGRPAYLFTAMVLYFGWMIFREQNTKDEFTRADYGFRFGGFVATLITGCALATLHFSPEGFRETAGGIVGQRIEDRDVHRYPQAAAPKTVSARNSSIGRPESPVSRNWNELDRVRAHPDIRDSGGEGT